MGAGPLGGFYASESDHPDQVAIMDPEPDLKPLREWVSQRLVPGPRRGNELTSDLREALGMGKHLNAVIRDMRKSNKIVASEFTGEFAQTRNPPLSLPTSRVTS